MSFSKFHLSFHVLRFYGCINKHIFKTIHNILFVGRTHHLKILTIFMSFSFYFLKNFPNPSKRLENKCFISLFMMWWQSFDTWTINSRSYLRTVCPSVCCPCVVCSCVCNREMFSIPIFLEFFILFCDKTSVN